MKVETLISCMRQKDASIASRSNVKTDCVIVNQCDTDSSATLPYTDADGNTVSPTEEETAAAKEAIRDIPDHEFLWELADRMVGRNK